MHYYEFTPKSLKDFKKLEKSIQSRIIKKLDYFCSSPDPLYFAERLSDWELGEYRFRIGDIRVVFDIEENILTIHKVGDRKNVYK